MCDTQNSSVKAHRRWTRSWDATWHRFSKRAWMKCKEVIHALSICIYKLEFCFCGSRYMPYAVAWCGASPVLGSGVDTGWLPHKEKNTHRHTHKQHSGWQWNKRVYNQDNFPNEWGYTVERISPPPSGGSVISHWSAGGNPAQLLTVLSYCVEFAFDSDQISIKMMRTYLFYCIWTKCAAVCHCVRYVVRRSQSSDWAGRGLPFWLIGDGVWVDEKINLYTYISL